MSTVTFPLPTLAAQISATGISAPLFENIVASEVATEQGIYGSDILLDPDDQDFQRLAIRCVAINDTNNLAIAVYNSFFPGFAQGVGLAAIVQINGLQKDAGGFSTAVLTIAGVVGTVIQAGVARDTNGNLWNLPSPVTIPISGSINVTATAQLPGAIAAAAGTINQTFTILNGWQSVTNPDPAAPGNPVEDDAELRARQAESTALTSISPLDSIIAAVGNSGGGIARFVVLQNNTRQTDSNGIPGNSIAAVVEGGNATSIAQAIQQTKAPGVGTFGTTSIPLVDQKGLPITISFFELTEVPIFVAMTIQPLTGYVSSTATAAVNALVAFLNALEIGEEVFFNWLLSVASMSGSPLGQTYVITSFTIGIAADALSNANIPITFNAAAQGNAANVIVTTA
jgi:uncharacterized phage protein gp47/JayE